MLRQLSRTCCLAAIAASRLLVAQDDGLLHLMREAIDNNPDLQAVRARNEERYPVCTDVSGVAPQSSQSDARAWRIVGRCALNRNKPDIAERAFQRAAELEPTADEYSLLGLSLVREGKLSQVVPALRKAAQLDSRNDQLYRAWGAYYLAQDDLKKAALYYAKALDILHPGGLLFLETDEDYATLARIYGRLGDHQSAVEAYREACFADECFDSSTTYGFGVELLATGHKEELETLIKSAELTNRPLASRLRALLAKH